MSLCLFNPSQVNGSFLYPMKTRGKIEWVEYRFHLLLNFSTRIFFNKKPVKGHSTESFLILL